MENLAQVWRGTATAHYARSGIGFYKAPVLDYVKPATADHDAQDVATLPLDYFGASGQGYLCARSRHGAQATAAVFQLTSQPQASQAYANNGSWQLWRNGRWLSGDVASYQTSATVPGFVGSPAIDTSSTIAHNGILFNGLGQASAGKAPATVTRLDSTPDYVYGVTDLTETYQGNINVSHAEREIIFLRALETTIILDRLESAEGNKTFLMHTQHAPVSNGGNSYVSVNGNEALRVTTLEPAAPSYDVVSSLCSDGSYRLEVTTSGAAEQEYFLNVVQARGKAEADLRILMTQDTDYWMLTLLHPTKGSAKILLNKGRTSVGGSIGVSATQTPPRMLTLLSTNVKNFRIGANAPVRGN